MHSCQQFILITRFLLAALLSSVLLFANVSGSVITPEISAGIMDLRNWDFEQDGNLQLRGKWNFYYQRFVDPINFSQTEPPKPDGLITVPGVWDDFIYNGEPIGGYGYATYHVKIRLGEPPQNLSIRINSFSTAARIFINGHEIGQAGIPAPTRAEMEPDYYPMVLDLPNGYSELDLVIHVSNFYHTQGGFWTVASIGLESKIRQDSNFNLVVNLLIVGSLIIIGLYHMSMYTLREYTRTPFYLGLLALTIGIRALVTGDIHLHHFFNTFPWQLMIRIEYLTVYLGVPLFMKFQQSVFPDEFPRKLADGIMGICLIFALIVVVTPVYFFTKTLVPFFLVGITASVIYMVITVQSIRHQQVGARFFLIASLILFAAFINDFLVSLEIIFTGYVTPLGFLVFMIIQAFLLSYRFYNSFKTIENQEQELRRHRDSLEEMVDARTTELIEANHRLLSLVIIDGLTQIANRRRFDEYLANEWLRMKREKKPLALIFSDIDYFKKYNDNYGHQAGDDCLKSVAQTLEKSINRPADLVARYGGEEFCAILPNTKLKGATKIAEQMRQNIADLQLNHAFSEVNEYITLSFGVATIIPDKKKSPEALIELADKRLYKAKKSGRNQMVYNGWKWR